MVRDMYISEVFPEFKLGKEINASFLTTIFNEEFLFLVSINEPPSCHTNLGVFMTNANYVCYIGLKCIHVVCQTFFKKLSALDLQRSAEPDKSTRIQMLIWSNFGR